MPDETQTERVQRKALLGVALLLLLLCLPWAWRMLVSDKSEPIPPDAVRLKPDSMTEAERATYLTPEETTEDVP